MAAPWCSLLRCELAPGRHGLTVRLSAWFGESDGNASMLPGTDEARFKTSGALKVCDLTQFYSPLSGGVKRYVAEKVRYLRERTTADEHVLIVPGERDERTGDERARMYTIASPLISRTSRYRILLRLEAIERILEKERPDII